MASSYAASLAYSFGTMHPFLHPPRSLLPRPQKRSCPQHSHGSRFLQCFSVSRSIFHYLFFAFFLHLAFSRSFPLSACLISLFQYLRVLCFIGDLHLLYFIAFIWAVYARIGASYTGRASAATAVFSYPIAVEQFAPNISLQAAHLRHYILRSFPKQTPVF